jgi:hypothetical protein
MDTSSVFGMLNTGLAVGCVVGCHWGLIQLAGKIRWYRHEEFTAKYGAMLEGNNVRSATGRYWTVIVLVRWSLTCLVLVAARDFYSV